MSEADKPLTMPDATRRAVLTHAIKVGGGAAAAVLQSAVAASGADAAPSPEFLRYLTLDKEIDEIFAANPDAKFTLLAESTLTKRLDGIFHELRRTRDALVALPATSWQHVAELAAVQRIELWDGGDEPVNEAVEFERAVLVAIETMAQRSKA